MTQEAWRPSEQPVAPQGTAADAIRYGSELQAWYARLFAAGRAGKPFNEPRPEPRITPKG